MPMINSWRRRLGLNVAQAHGEEEVSDWQTEEAEDTPARQLKRLVDSARAAASEERLKEAEDAFSAALCLCETSIEEDSGDTGIPLVQSKTNGYLLWLYCCRSEVRGRLGDLRGALEDAELAHTRNPTFETAHLRIVEALMALNRPFDALRACKLGLEQNHKQKQLLCLLNEINADLLLQRHTPQEKHEAGARHAAALTPSDIQALESDMERQCMMKELVGSRKHDWQVVRATGRGMISAAPQPRHAHAVAVVSHPTHAFFVFGGYGYTNKAHRMSDLLQFDLPTQSWVQHQPRSLPADGPTARHSSTMVSDAASMTLWLFGGTSEDGPVGDLYRYDIAGKRWSRVEPNVQNNSDMAPAMLDGMSHAAGGGAEGEIAPPTQERQPAPRWGHAMVADPSGGGFFLFGGRALKGEHHNLCNDLWRFNFETSVWTLLYPDTGMKEASLNDTVQPCRRQFHSLIHAEGSVYVVGGFQGMCNLDDIYKFDIRTRTWEHVCNFGLPLRSFGCVEHNGYVYVTCGMGDEGSTSVAARVPLAGGQVETMAVSYAPDRRHFASAVKWNNSIWLFGGYCNKNFNDVWRFHLEDPVVAGRSAAAGGLVGRDLMQLVGKEDHHDVCFIVNGNQPVYAHKAILAARCERFASMFASGMVESEYRAKIHLPGVSLEPYMALMHWLYGGRLPNTDPGLILQVLQLADEYILQDLKTHCSFILQTIVTDDTVESMLEVAEVHNAFQLASFCRNYAPASLLSS